MSYPTLPVRQPEDVAVRAQISSVANTAAYLAEQTDVVFLLKQAIETLTSDLQQYAQKENASQFYIDRQNKLIAILVTVYNNIEGVQLLDFWQSVEQEMQRISSADRQISGYTISIRTRPTGDVFSFIQINSFNK